MQSKRYKQCILVLLMVILAFNFVDRLALGLVLQDIKLDLHLSDTQLGFLSGIAFALFYSVMGIPIARWADKGNRVRIIALTTLLWSVLVSCCGLAQNFIQLLLIRVGVGVGEAGCMPPANSLIADYFDRAERPRATSLYMQGLNISPIIAYFVAGWLNQLYGWRTMFVCISAPGLLLGLLALWIIKEPRQTKSEPQIRISRLQSVIHEREASANLLQVTKILWRNVTFRHLLLAFAVYYFFACGITQWTPAFFMRSFGMRTGELGTWFAIVQSVCGLAGTYWGGVWVSRYAAKNEALQLKAMAIANGAFNAGVWALIYLSPNSAMALLFMGISTLGGMTILGPMSALGQTLVPAHMRASAVAIIYLFANLIGLGFGPLAVGALSDALQGHFGDESLRYALLAASPGYLWVSWHLWRAIKTVRSDLEIVAKQDYDNLSFSRPASYEVS